MASVLLTSTAPPDDPQRPHPYDQLDRMQMSAARDRHKAHAPTDDPDEADLILFVENCSTIRHYLEVRRHPYYRQFPTKCHLFSRHDHPIPLLPGVYPSIERRWHNRQWTRSGGYLKAYTNDFVEDLGGLVERDYLFSFLGAASTHPLREALLALPSENAYLLDTTPQWPYGELGPAERTAFQQRYVEVTRRSRFVLCPRGRGASSIRLFETMRMGRAPVIISDAWVPPDGPDWSSFSVRVPEADVHRLPALLAERASEAVAMGRRARAAWDDWFSVESTFHRTAEACLDMQSARRWPFFVLRGAAFAQFLRPLHFRALVHTLRKNRPSHAPVPV